MWVMIFLKIYKQAMNSKSNEVYLHAANGNRMKRLINWKICNYKAVCYR